MSIRLGALARQALRRLSADVSPQPPVPAPAQESIFGSYQEALNASQSSYSDHDLSRFRKERFVNFRSTIGAKDFVYPEGFLHLAYAVQSVATRHLRILDFGGVFGDYYFLLKTISDKEFDYIVVENESLVEMGRVLPNHPVKLVSEFPDSLDGLDIFFTSGTLQCIETPYDLLARVCRLKPAFVVLARNSFSRGPDIFRVQKSRLFDNGAGPLPAGWSDRIVEYPHRSVNIDTVRDTLRRCGYVEEITTASQSGVIPHGDAIFGLDITFRKSPMP